MIQGHHLHAVLFKELPVLLGDPEVRLDDIIKPDFRITQEHGQFFEKDGMQMMALYHPAALLRDPGKKPETFEDLKRLQARIRELCVRTELTFS